MKRMALVADGKVHNVIMAKPGFRPSDGSIAVESLEAGIGDLHDGVKFTKNESRPSKEELILHARRRHAITIYLGIKFNLAKPGDDLKIVHIRIDNLMREGIRDLAYLAEHGESSRIVLHNNQIIDLSAAQILDLRDRIARHIARSHAVLAALIEAIDTGHIASIDAIDAPETATAIKIDSWCAPHG